MIYDTFVLKLTKFPQFICQNPMSRPMNVSPVAFLLRVQPEIWSRNIHHMCFWSFTDLSTNPTDVPLYAITQYQHCFAHVTMRGDCARSYGKNPSTSLVHRWRNSSFLHYKSVKILLFSRSTVFLVGFPPIPARHIYYIWYYRADLLGLSMRDDLMASDFMSY